MRPRPNPFERPSTRYNGVLTPPPSEGGDGSIARFWAMGEGSTAGLKESCCVLENFKDFLKILSNRCTQKALKLDLNDISEGLIFVSGR